MLSLILLAIAGVLIYYYFYQSREEVKTNDKKNSRLNFNYETSEELGTDTDANESTNLKASENVALENNTITETEKKHTLEPINLVTASKYQSMDSFKNTQTQMNLGSPDKQLSNVTSINREYNNVPPEDIHTNKVDYLNLNALSPYNATNQPYYLLENDTVNSNNTIQNLENHNESENKEE